MNPLIAFSAIMLVSTTAWADCPKGADCDAKLVPQQGIVEPITLPTSPIIEHGVPSCVDVDGKNINQNVPCGAWPCAWNENHTIEWCGPTQESKPWYGMIVYSDGRVQTNEFNTSGDNHQLCLESLSYVQYGMSIEDKKKRDAEIEAARKVAEEKWRKDHPCTETKIHESGWPEAYRQEECRNADGSITDTEYDKAGKELGGGTTSWSYGGDTSFGTSITAAVCFQQEDRAK